jgi:uridine kinase
VNRELQVAAAAIERLRGSGPSVLVAIDGPGGSGKSTVAAMLARFVGAAIVAGDDFYRVLDPTTRLALGAEDGYRRYFDWERLGAQVLRPLRAGQAARYDRYDWQRGVLGEAVNVVASDVTIVEGVYAFRPELREYYDLSILVETPNGERWRRLRARGENDEHWLSRWDAAEQWYFSNALARDDVDFVVPGVSQEYVHKGEV